MAELPSIGFSKPAVPKKGVAVVFTDESLSLGAAASEIDAASDGAITRAMKVAGYKGAAMAGLDIVAPAGVKLERIAVVGLGKAGDLSEFDWLRLGGAAMGAIAAAKTTHASIHLELPDGKEITAEQASDIAIGAKLRGYSFDKYKTAKNGEDKPKGAKVTICVSDHAGAAKLWETAEGVADGAILARDLVNEPANVLGTEEFAKKAKSLEKLGVEVEILGEKEMSKLGMHALLGVARGSVRPPKLAIMQWKGGKSQQQPVAFVGKGVVFDSGGISIKPGAGMEDMKGDMGGAAAVTGLMHALASRKAKVNAIGVIGLVENMPDADAQRPGDIVTAMSGTTIEVINTDAEGRLVLADALWYTQDRFKPAFMINLATLTGAIIIALGNHHAGLFSNNDELSGRLTAAGLATGEKVWRMPIGPEYEKLIEAKFADIKNTGGRPAGSITAAQFLQHFVNDVPWAHLDVAGTAMGSPETEISKSWASGFGVRLLDRLVRDHYEA
ncbi:leucyl aminopeptidase [Breoghania corrubedonensis]|uniref:Probable cytosol aminopeptidase n=1 Tax=Breoghania corrubedonensis TaxID=665038 RepID=A0A2T5V9K5_9HYPH|nr:leucyl aminopeptidase [Breoghania corrubedonensis]PTW60433.1 leucyl aminopeptidase [Breoghania corrubedonensis]